ncbi:MAG: SAM-dependent methyltransferase [Tissierellia bacterium]|nr:SAM-dependent methyltransferase [Tissierellia bacterium]
MIRIIGLGPGDEKMLTLEAYQYLIDENPNFFRTKSHGVIPYIIQQGITYESFDHLYDEGKSFEEVYEKIVELLRQKEEEYGIINYFVPGNPHVAEKTVTMLLEKNPHYHVISGLSFIEPVLKMVGRDAVTGLKFLDYDFDITEIETHCDLLITQVYNARIASDISLKLQEVYGDDYRVHILIDAGLPTEKHYRIPLYEVSRLEEINHQTAIYVEGNQRVDVLSLIREIRREISQNPMDYNDLFIEKLKEKLYNLTCCLDSTKDDELFKIFYLILYTLFVVERKGYYNFSEIFEYIHEKIGENGDFFENNVENNLDLGYNCSSLTKIPTATRNSDCPIIRAQDIIDHAMNFGFMWKDFEGVRDKIMEELDEVEGEIGVDDDRLSMEVGDFIFTSINMSRFLGMDPWEALNKSTDKFFKRFRKMEIYAKSNNLNLKDLTLGELDQIYNETK